MKYTNDVCPQGDPSCEIEYTFDNYEGPIHIYLFYKSWFSSFYVFSKTQSFGNLYNTLNLNDREDACYPVTHVDEYKSVLDDYGLTNVPPKI